MSYLSGKIHGLPTTQCDTRPGAVDAVYSYSRYFRILSITICAAALTLAQLRADDITLNNGTVLSGKYQDAPGISQPAIAKNRSGNVPSNPLGVIDNDIKRYFVPIRQIRNRVAAPPPAPYTTFEIEQAGKAGGRQIQQVGVYQTGTPFSEYGRRNIQIFAGNNVVVTQGITSISPTEVKISALNFSWDYAVTTSSLKLDNLLQIISKKIKPNDIAQRLTFVSFLLELGRHDLALSELERMSKEFPDNADQIASFRDRTRQLLAQKILNEIKSRKEAGQHQLAFKAVHDFPREDINAANSRQVQEFKADYEQGVESVDQIDAELRLLISRLEKHPEIETLKECEREILESLGYDELDRMKPVLRAALTPNTSDDAKLALALSGWMVGSDNAIESLTTAVSMAKARKLMVDYLRSDDPNIKAANLSDLVRLEGVGPETFGKLVPMMPLERPAQLGLSPSSTFYTSPEGTGYHVQIPLEYRSEREYPLIIALNDPSTQADTELRFWAGHSASPGLAMERGYLTMSVEYLKASEPLENAPEQYHARILSALRDVMRRFRVDQERVFIAGHDIGGTAAIDMSLSHPDLFAACVAFTAKLPSVIKDYRDNKPTVPMYLVNGSIDSAIDMNEMFHIDHMMAHGNDIIYAEFKNRGHEFYYEEVPAIFDWLPRHRRVNYPSSFDVQMSRPTENQFFWLRLANLPANSRKTLQTYAQISPNKDVVNIRTGAEKIDVLLSPELVSFEKHVRISIGRRDLPRQIPERNIETMLEELKLTGDRKRLVWMRVSI